jgi:protein gp37
MFCNRFAMRHLPKYAYVVRLPLDWPMGFEKESTSKMAESTKIEWADHTFNPWIGCTKVSPACDHCYAEVLMGQRYKRVRWGAGEARQRTSKANWRKPLAWNRKAGQAGCRPFVFCASLADVFDNEVDQGWRSDLFDLIEQTPQLVWLLLTKRVGNVLAMVDRPLPRNVAIGATMANQAEYERDIPKLLTVKSRLSPLFTFGSFEPLLGPVRLDRRAPDWIIVGGESGHGARAMDLDWARALRDQSHSLQRVFNFKQVGGKGASHGSDRLDDKQHFDRPDVRLLESGQALDQAA